MDSSGIRDVPQRRPRPLHPPCRLPRTLELRLQADRPHSIVSLPPWPHRRILPAWRLPGISEAVWAPLAERPGCLRPIGARASSRSWVARHRSRYGPGGRLRLDNEGHGKRE